MVCIVFDFMICNCVVYVYFNLIYCISYLCYGVYSSFINVGTTFPGEGENVAGSNNHNNSLMCITTSIIVKG